MHRRRLLMYYAQHSTGYFDGVNTRDGDLNGLRFKWFSFEESNKFQLERYLDSVKYLKIEMSLANPSRDKNNLDPLTTLLPMGYNPNKKYNLRIKVLSKIIDEGYNVEDFNGNGNFTFLFKGLNVTKSSESIGIRDIVPGTEFIIPIEKGEILNNFCVKYSSDTIDGGDKDYYPCRILFEACFEEIAE